MLTYALSYSCFFGFQDISLGRKLDKEVEKEPQTLSRWRRGKQGFAVLWEDLISGRWKKPAGLWSGFLCYCFRDALCISSREGCSIR